MSHTPGPWMIATSNSWRRIVSRDHGSVCEPIVHHRDHHPDLHFRNGGEDGPDARLLAAAPELLDALRHMRWCASCAEGPWEVCDGGRAALAAIAKAEMEPPKKQIEEGDRG